MNKPSTINLYTVYFNTQIEINNQKEIINKSKKNNNNMGQEEAKFELGQKIVDRSKKYN